jgi:hypothetical protein
MLAGRLMQITLGRCVVQLVCSIEHVLDCTDTDDAIGDISIMERSRLTGGALAAAKR